MKKLTIAGGVIGAAVVIRRLRAVGGIDFGQVIERMPEDAPPKWMFRNISAIRDNTERILQLLESGRTQAGS